MENNLPEEDEAEKKKTEEGTEKPVSNESETRLYVMNLSYTVTNDELADTFGKFGVIENIEIPLRKGGQGVALGIAYITYRETEGAITAFATLDKSYF